MKRPSIPFSSAPTPSPDTGTAFVVATRTSDTCPGWRLARSSSQTAPAAARKPLRGPWPSPPGNRKACLALACTVGHACQMTAPYRISELRCGTNLGRKGRERERGNIAPGGGLGALADALANDPALRFRAVCLGLKKARAAGTAAAMGELRARHRTARWSRLSIRVISTPARRPKRSRSRTTGTLLWRRTSRQTARFGGL